jgi:hypothetical protein
MWRGYILQDQVLIPLEVSVLISLLDRSLDIIGFIVHLIFWGEGVNCRVGAKFGGFDGGGDVYSVEAVAL